MTARSYTALNWYDAPLYYDIVFDADTESEATFLAAISEMYGRPGGRRVLEPACGSGRLMAALVRRGYSCRGFDINPAMLTFARQRLPPRGPWRLWRDNLADFAAPPGAVDLCHCLVSTFKYLLQPAAAAAHLQRSAAALAPGGVYALGLHLSDYLDPGASCERWFGRRGAVDVICTIDSGPPAARRRREAVRSRLEVRGDGHRARRLETCWDFRTYSAGQLGRLVAEVPDLQHVATYDFSYDLRRPRQGLDDGRLDSVLVLRRRRRDGPRRRAATPSCGRAPRAARPPR